MSTADGLVETFLELVALDGPSGRERMVADFVRARLEALGLEVHEDGAGAATGGNCGNLVCTWQGGGRWALVAHLDTVQPTAGLAPRRLPDRIAADPAGILGADDRAGVTAILDAFEHHVAVGGGPATALFTIREEVDFGGSTRIEWPAAVEAAYVLDSSLRPGNWIAQGWGARHFEARVTGRAAHAGVAPETGISAISTLARAIGGLDWGRLGEDATSNVGTISGGSADNIVAAEARCTGEARAATAGRLEAVVGAITSGFEAAVTASGATLELDWISGFEPYLRAAEAPWVQRLEAAMAAAGIEPRAASTPGGSDAHVFNARGLPTINLGTGAQKPHGPEEHILLEDLAATARLARALLAASA